MFHWMRLAIAEFAMLSTAAQDLSSSSVVYHRTSKKKSFGDKNFFFRDQFASGRCSNFESGGVSSYLHRWQPAYLQALVSTEIFSFNVN